MKNMTKQSQHAVNQVEIMMVPPPSICIPGILRAHMHALKMHGLPRWTLLRTALFDASRRKHVGCWLYESGKHLRGAFRRKIQSLVALHL